MFYILDNQKTPEKRQSCVGKPNCPTCHLFKDNGGPCTGCNTKENARQRSCDTQCSTCGGHSSAPAPALCCKSPFKNLLLEPVDHSYEFSQQKAIKLKTKAVLGIQGGVGSAAGPGSPFIDKLDAIAVSLRHVWSESGGWFSTDLKDYMKISKSKKLILTTSLYDDVLDKAWRQDLFDGFDKVGFDFWHPLVFSIYDHDSRMMQYYNYRRTQFSLSRSMGHFSSIPLPASWFDLEDDFAKMVAKVPNVSVNTVFGARDEKDLRRYYGEFKRLHEIMPKNGTIWLVGTASPVLIRIALVAAPGRDIYSISTGPWVGANKGQLFTEEGKLEKARHLSKRDLIFQSQENFVKLMEGCYRLRSGESLCYGLAVAETVSAMKPNRPKEIAYGSTWRQGEEGPQEEGEERAAEGQGQEEDQALGRATGRSHVRRWGLRKRNFGPHPHRPHFRRKL